MYPLGCSLAVLYFVAYSANAANLPSTFQRCHVSPQEDNKVNQCLVKAISGAIKILTDNGSPELGALDLDPMLINSIRIEQGEDRPVAIKLQFTDNYLSGLKDFKLFDVSGKLSSPDGFKMISHGTAPLLSLEGPYNISGRVLVLGISGVGNSKMTMVNCNVSYTIEGVPETKNGKEYLKITNVDLKMDPERLEMAFENLFNGDKLLSDNMNTFLNANWKEIFTELKPSIEEAFAAIFKEYSRRIFAKVLFDDVFLLS